MEQLVLQHLYSLAVARCEANDAWLFENNFAEETVKMCVDLLRRRGQHICANILEAEYLGKDNL